MGNLVQVLACSTAAAVFSAEGLRRLGELEEGVKRDTWMGHGAGMSMVVTHSIHGKMVYLPPTFTIQINYINVGNYTIFPWIHGGHGS